MIEVGARGDSAIGWRQISEMDKDDRV